MQLKLDRVTQLGQTVEMYSSEFLSVATARSSRVSGTEWSDTAFTELPASLQDTAFESAWIGFEAALLEEKASIGTSEAAWQEWARAGLARQRAQVPLYVVLRDLEVVCDDWDQSLVAVLLELRESVSRLTDAKTQQFNESLCALSILEARAVTHLTMLTSFSRNLLDKDEAIKQLIDRTDELDDLFEEEQVLERKENKARRRGDPVNSIRVQLTVLKQRISEFRTSSDQRQLQARLRKLAQFLPEIVQRFPELDPFFRTCAQGIEICSLSDFEGGLQPLTGLQENKVVPGVFKAKSPAAERKEEGTDDEEDDEDKFVILKKFGASSLRAMRRSAHIMARIQHPNVVQLSGIVRDGEDWYLRMPFYPKGDLRRWLQENPPDSTEQRNAEALSILRCVLQGLEVLHQVGILHRDLKPENVLLEEFPKGTG